jgi:proline iminopeptidase
MRTALAALLACGCLDPSAPGNLVRPTVDEDPALPALEVNGTRLHVVVRGPAGAPAIVLLHGGPGGDLAYFERLTERVDGRSLADDHRLVLWDQRGTGLSRRHGEGELTMAHYHRDLEALIDAVSPGAPVILVGQSWGGLYGARYLGRHPARVRAAVLINPQALTRALHDANPQPVDVDPFAEWLSDPMWARGLVSPADHARADFLLGTMIGVELPRYHNQVDVPNLRPGAAVFKFLNREWTDDYDYTAGLDAVPFEVLVIAGERDEILGAAFQRKQLHHFARARLVVMPGAGHQDPLTVYAPETVRWIRAYLDAGAR